MISLHLKCGFRVLAFLLLSFIYCFDACPSNEGIIASKFIDIDSDKVLFEQNPTVLMIPASNQKIITLYSAFKHLDLNDSFKTIVSTETEIKNGKLKNIYLKFNADPDLTVEHLRMLIHSLHTSGLREVEQIIIDDFEFELKYFNQGWSVDQTKFCFSAPISSIILDNNCFFPKAVLSDGKLVLKNPNRFIYLKNELSIVKEMKNCDFELNVDFNNSYRLYGCATENVFPANLMIAVQNPRDYVKKVVKQLLIDEHIKNSNISFGHTAVKVIELGSHKSRNIAELLKEMMKVSNNLIAETIFKKTALPISQPASWKNAVKQLQQDFLADFGFDEQSYKVYDGSGQSRKNLLSPEIFTHLLKKAFLNEKTFPDWLSFFNEYEYKYISRTQNKKIEKIYAKTGSLEGVSSLSGYIFTNDQKRIAFSIIANNSPLNPQDLQIIIENHIFHALAVD